MASSEAAVQAKIKAQLEKAGWFVTKLIQTSTNGIPDLLCIRAGQVLFIEVKSEKGKPSPLQQYRIQKIKDQNIQVIITNNPTDIAHLCTATLSKPPLPTFQKECPSSPPTTTSGRSSRGKSTSNVI